MDLLVSVTPNILSLLNAVTPYSVGYSSVQLDFIFSVSSISFSSGGRVILPIAALGGGNSSSIFSFGP